jgi:hypothetical protein
MEDFKKMVKMKTGGSVSSALKEENKHCSGGKINKYKEGGNVDMKQDKALIKKAFKQHDEAEHDKEPTEIKLKKGGRSKKAEGSVKKYKAGGAIEMKKDSGDKDTIRKIKATGVSKAKASSEAAKRPNFKASDVEKEKSKPAGDKDTIKKVKPTGDKKADAPNKAAIKPAPKGIDAIDDLKGGGKPRYKKGGNVKKFDTGGTTGAGGIATQNPIPPSIASQLMQAAPGAALQGMNPPTMGTNPLPTDNPVMGSGMNPSHIVGNNGRPMPAPSFAQEYMKHNDPMSHMPEAQINRIISHPAIQQIIKQFTDR